VQHALAGGHVDHAVVALTTGSALMTAPIRLVRAHGGALSGCGCRAGSSSPAVVPQALLDGLTVVPTSADGEATPALPL
jgi:hypothetical protein